ncbi:brachyurin-like isoform X2 [Euwallacea fornicatus]|uniref:brachyurin-like isoform X2 n=1 Tax=Euwallacea fornicatus TaxID=995702 RepID=UPI0033905DDE
MIKLSHLLMIRITLTVGAPFYDNNERSTLVGGVEVTPHSLPYQVGLIIDDRKFCGGVLISSKYVLTAAHCVSYCSGVQVILGAHNINYVEDTQIISLNPTVIVHQNYSGSYENDIALLKLSTYVQLTHEIEPIFELADDDCGDFLGATALLSGWGYTYHGGALKEKLRKVSLNVMSNTICSFTFAALDVTVAESHLCTCGNDSITGRIGACFGDSGGPLVVGRTLIGLVSFGDEICEAGNPTVFTRISHFREWIYSLIPPSGCHHPAICRVWMLFHFRRHLSLLLKIPNEVSSLGEGVIGDVTGVCKS